MPASPTLVAKALYGNHQPSDLAKSYLLLVLEVLAHNYDGGSTSNPAVDVVTALEAITSDPVSPAMRDVRQRLNSMKMGGR